MVRRNISGSEQAETVQDRAGLLAPLTRGTDGGFTLIELMVVVAVIALLAAVAIPTFLGVQARAADAVVQSDLAHAKIATITWGAKHSGALPDIDTQLGDLGYTASPYAAPGVPPAYKSGSTADLFCIIGTSGSGQQYSVTTRGSVRKGFCPFSTNEW